MFTGNLKIIQDFENNKNPTTLSPKVKVIKVASPKVKLTELMKRNKSWDNFIKIQWPWTL
jgi:hypothetical protein